MPIPQMPGTGLSSLDDVINYVTRLERELRFLMESGLDSTNMFEVGGWRVTPSQIVSLDNSVGMSSLETGADDVRFFAGTKFKVTKSGILYAVDGNFSGNITGSMITGGTIRTAAPGNVRIELSGGILAGYYSDDQYHGLVFNPSATSNFFDMWLYHDGSQYLEFYDEGTMIKIRPGSGTSKWTLGLSGKTTFCDGQWTFLNTATVDLGPNTALGKVQYAGQADSALSASSAQSVDWSNVTNHPDGTTTPLVNGTGSAGTSILYSRQDHVHPTDTSRQATITGAATTITGSNLTASRALVSDASGKVAVTSVTSTEVGYVSGVTSAIQTQIDAKAPLASPALTGTPTSTTPATSDNSTKIATTAYVKAQIPTPKVNEFQGPASTGNFSVTGVGFTPRALDLHAVEITTTRSVQCNSKVTSGVSVSHYSASDGTNATSSTVGKAIALYSPAGTLLGEATFVSMDSDGFTLNFTNVLVRPYVSFMAFP